MNILPVAKMSNYDYPEPPFVPRPSLNSIQKISNGQGRSISRYDYPYAPIEDFDTEVTTESSKPNRPNRWPIILIFLLFLIILGFIYYYWEAFVWTFAILVMPICICIDYCKQFVTDEDDTTRRDQPKTRYTKLESSSETEDSCAVSEKTGPTVFSSKPTSSTEDETHPLGKLSLPPPPKIILTPPDTTDASESPEISLPISSGNKRKSHGRNTAEKSTATDFERKPEQAPGNIKTSKYHRHRHRHSHHSSKRPIVAIHATKSDNIKVEITTDQDDYSSSAEVEDDEEEDLPKNHLFNIQTEREADEQDYRGTTEKESIVSTALRNKSGRPKKKAEEMQAPNNFRDYDTSYGDTVGTSIRLSSDDERDEVFSRYAGSTTQKAYEKFH